MADRLELTDAELDAAAALFHVPGGMAFNGRQNYIRESVRCINMVRSGDPVGTIRRDPEHGHIAVRCKDTFQDEAHWVEVTRSGDGGRVLTPSGGVITDWPIIYQPESDA